MADREVIEAIKERVDLVELISETVTLQKRGQNFIGLCPFHNEKTPSFNVSPQRGSYYCFGCQAKGDVFDWVQEREFLSFPEALERLAARAGIELRNQSGSRQSTGAPTEDDGHRQRIDDCRHLCRDASRLFQEALAAPVGAAARNYLQERGISRKMIEAAGFGFAPNDALSHLQASEELLQMAGLMVGRRFLFGDRIVLPLRDEQGRPVAFTGRRFLPDTEGGKYVNSPATPIFEKSRLLYGLDRARSALRAQRPLILVEGPLDGLALAQYGIDGAIASCGTSLSAHHAQLIARRSRDVQPVLLFDGDQAGRDAAEKAAFLLLGAGLNPRVLHLAEGEDPDNWVRAVGEEEARRRIDSAPAVLDQVAAALQRAPTQTVDQRSARETEAGRWLAQIPEGALLNAFSDRLREILGRLPSRSISRRPRPLEAEIHQREDRLEVPPRLRQLGESEPRVAALWNRWCLTVEASYGDRLAQWGLSLPTIRLSGGIFGPVGNRELQQQVLRCLNQLHVQAMRVLRQKEVDQEPNLEAQQLLNRLFHRAQPRRLLEELIRMDAELDLKGLDLGDMEPPP